MHEVLKLPNFLDIIVPAMLSKIENMVYIIYHV